MGQNFSSLEYGKCRDLTRFIHVQVNFEKKNPVLPIEKFPSLVLPRNVIGCGRTKRVNWVYFLETWLKILNNLIRLKVGYNKITGLYFMSGRTEMGYEVG